MKKVISILLFVLFLYTFAGCDKKVTDADTTPTTNEPETLIDPSGIDFGYNEEKNEYDRWYLQGTDDVVYIYFTYDNADSFENCVGTYNLVKSGVVKQSASLALSPDNHLAPVLSSSTYVDFGFEDNFNVYNFATDELYSRGNADEYNAYFANKIYTKDSKDLCTLSFNDDFTLTKLDKEDATSGTWEVTAKNTLVCTFGDDKVSYKINYNDDMSVKSLENNGEHYYTEISEGETVNKYKVY